MKKAVSAEFHRRVARDEEDNTGLQALHTTERTGESALRLARDVQEVRLRHQAKPVASADVAKSTGSNPISRANQRRAIRREYLKAKTGRSTPIRPEDAKPGDVIFFQDNMGEGTEGITHCGLYVGNNMMVHCGNPCSYADLTDSYWQQHFYGFGRLYQH